MEEDKLKTVNIKGKEYVEVNERIKYFRKKYENWSLSSEIVKLEDGLCVIKAIVKDENDIVKATGIAYEKEDSTFINKTSYIENCETSAWGRALGNLGIGIDTSMASADEVENAQLNQRPKANPNAKPSEKQINYLSSLLKQMGKKKEEVEEITNKLQTADQASAWIEKAKKIIDGELSDDIYRAGKQEEMEASERYVDSLAQSALERAAGY